MEEKVAACEAQRDAWMSSDVGGKVFVPLLDSIAEMGVELTIQELSLQKTQDLADTLAIAKSYLVSNLNAAKAGEATRTKGGDALTQAQQSAFNDVLSQGLADLTVLQTRVTARISSLQRSIDELTARHNAAENALSVYLIKEDHIYDAFDECLKRARAASAQPAATPAKVPASNNLPGFVTNTPPPALAPSILIGSWTFSTSGGCQYQGGFVPGVNHAPDGPMQLEDDGKGGYSGKIAGAEIKSLVDNGALNGNDFVLTIHPKSYNDDPVLNPPKPEYTGGWDSTLDLRGKLSVNGDIVTGQVFLNKSTLNCTFTMTR